MRGYLVKCGPVTPPRRASDPSPGPRRLVKTPATVHPLPWGEGEGPISIPFLQQSERRRPIAAHMTGDSQDIPAEVLILDDIRQLLLNISSIDADRFLLQVRALEGDLVEKFFHNGV
jgi:hypothetical protein